MPNPFQDQLTISFNLENKGNIKIEILNINGQIIKSISNSFSQKGNQKFAVDLNDLSTGIYYIRLITDGNTGMKKIIKH